jgi:hypothetical protein
MQTLKGLTLRMCHVCRFLNFTRFLRVAADDLDLICREFLTTVTLELDVLYKKRPDIIAESIGFQMTL